MLQDVFLPLFLCESLQLCQPINLIQAQVCQLAMSGENQSLSASSWCLKHIHQSKRIVACELLPGGYCNMVSINTLRCPSTRNWTWTAQCAVLMRWTLEENCCVLCVLLSWRDKDTHLFVIIADRFNISSQQVINMLQILNTALNTMLCLYRRVCKHL